MPTVTESEGVPLDVWLFDKPTPTTALALRRQVAARLIDSYSPPGGVVVDLAPGAGEALAAATAAGRSAVAISSPPELGCRRRPAALDELRGMADLVLVLPPATRLAPLQPHAVSGAAMSALCRRAAPLLGAGGVLVLGALPGPHNGNVDPLAAAVDAGASVGLSYLQHVVVVIASADAAGEEPPSGPVPSVGRVELAGADDRRRVDHVDLVVLRRVR